MYEQIARNKRLAGVYMAVFFANWVGIGGFIGLVAAALSQRPGLPPATAQDVATGAALFAVIAAGTIWYVLQSGPRMILSIARAEPADPRMYPELHNLVDALAIGDGIPKPAVYVIDDPSPNAFATGTRPEHAAITATTGLLALMNREELEGVIGHEMSHIKNYDVRLLLVVSTLIGLAGLAAGIVWRSAFFTRGRRGRGDGGQAMLLIVAIGAALALVAFLFGPLIRLALSRRREELADVSGVELTRNPAGLISALRKLEQNDRPPAAMNPAVAAMCIDDAARHHDGWLAHLFDSHPPLSERIAVLERISAGQSV